MEPISLEKRIQDPAFGEKLTHLYGQEGAGDARARCAAVIRVKRVRASSRKGASAE